jgi:hypothetical protein
MSRLIDNLTHIRQNEPQPIGFAALGRATAEKPRMQLIAYLKANDLDDFSEVLNSADAVLMEIGRADDISALEKACETNKNTPIGGRLKASNAETLKKAANVACDFVVFAGTIPLTLTQKEKMGRILELDTSMNERFLRAAGDLPIDAVLVFDKSEDNSLTVNRLIFFQYLVNSINKPILVSVPVNFTQAELQALWDIGISGVVVELADKESTEKLAGISTAIKSLAPPAFRKKFKASATLPRMQPEPEKPPEEEGDEEEEE